MTGILISDSIELTATSLTESEVSALNFEENIVVLAAVGALQEIASDTSITPLMPQRYITATESKGNINSLNAKAT